MKTNELMLGNYYLSFGVDLKQVETLHKDKILIDFQPIPLTKEWLLKFGFIQNENDKTIYKYLDFIYFRLEKEFNNSIDFYYISANLRGVKAGDFMCRLYFVHQLQNLYFALMGKELTIKLK